MFDGCTIAIAAFARDFCERHDRLNILLNNGGVVNLEKFSRTPEGREMHMGTNHLGHFALPGRLFSILAATENARVVTVSSAAYRSGAIDFDDLDWQVRTYDRVKAYGDIKIANLLFMHALQSRFEAAGSSAISVAAHPGLTGTERQQSIGIGGALAHWVASPVEKGVRSQLLASTDPSVRGGEFYGPRFGVLGRPMLQTPKPEAVDSETSRDLWRVSEELTGVAYPA